MYFSGTPLVLSLSLFLGLHLHPAATHPVQSNSVSIPLRRVSQSHKTANLPPTIVHQQHTNRGIRRLDLFRGSRPTPDSELFVKLQKRLNVLPPHLLRRYVILPSVDSSGPGDHIQPVSLETWQPGQTDTESNRPRPFFNHTIPLTIESFDVGYYGVVKIGTPRRDFKILMDSGSADFWVGSVNCQAEGGTCGNHAFLGLVESSTFNITTDEWETYYGSGFVYGNLAYDDVTIAGLTLRTYQFGVATFESAAFASAPFDGLCGLAKSGLSRQGTIPVVEALRKRGHIKNAIVSYKIPRLADHKDDGEMTLGSLNPAKFDSRTLVTVPNVSKRGFWEAKIGAVRVNRKSMGWSNRTAIFDTGTTLLIAPQEDVNAIHKRIPGAVFDGEAWTVPCKLNAAFSLVIGGREFSVDSRDLAWAPVDPEQPTGNCISGVSTGSIGGDNRWLVGDVFLKNVYMSTNADTDEISFAKLTR